jgi:hypothetical protein
MRVTLSAAESAIKGLVRTTFLYDLCWARWSMARWERAGRPVPPPNAVKQQVVRQTSIAFGLTTLVETGTFRGDMIRANRHTFSKIYSIELDERLFEQAKVAFARFSHVNLVHGDSGVQVRELVSTLKSPTLFWLDAHYSGGPTARGPIETPIESELSTILDAVSVPFAILIDDARCFDGGHDYPTLLAVSDFVRQRRPDLTFEVRNDIIRILPSEAFPQALTL